MSGAEDTAWTALLSACHAWAENHMDQWEMFKFDTKYGPVFVTLTHETTHPDAFDKVDALSAEGGAAREMLGVGE